MSARRRAVLANIARRALACALLRVWRACWAAGWGWARRGLLVAIRYAEHECSAHVRCVLAGSCNSCGVLAQRVRDACTVVCRSLVVCVSWPPARRVKHLCLHLCEQGALGCCAAEEAVGSAPWRSSSCGRGCMHAGMSVMLWGRACRPVHCWCILFLCYTARARGNMHCVRAQGTKRQRIASRQQRTCRSTLPSGNRRQPHALRSCQNTHTHTKD